jgi:hypothetical protein
MLTARLLLEIGVDADLVRDKLLGSSQYRSFLAAAKRTLPDVYDVEA